MFATPRVVTLLRIPIWLVFKGVRFRNSATWKWPESGALLYDIPNYFLVLVMSRLITSSLALAVVKINVR